MNISYKKLLPLNMRETRWGQYIEVFQNIMSEIKTQKVDVIKNQNDIESMTFDQFVSLAKKYGFDLVTYAGYTSTEYYLKKQVKTIVKRIETRNTRPGYQYINYVYDFLGDAYPIMSDGGELFPNTAWWDLFETDLTINTLDSADDNLLYNFPIQFDESDFFDVTDESIAWDYTYPVYSSPKETSLNEAFLDTSNFETLDLEPMLNKMTRGILIHFSPKFVENNLEFFSYETMLAYVHDCLLNKKRTERLYFEPTVYIIGKYDKTKRITNYTSYDGSISSQQKTLLIKDNLASVSDIHFGNSHHTTIDNTITDVSSPINNYDLSILTDCDLIMQNTHHLQIRKKLKAPFTFENFSEITLYNSNGECLLYSCFPKINYVEKSRNNVFLDISLV